MHASPQSDRKQGFGNRREGRGDLAKSDVSRGEYGMNKLRMAALAVFAIATIYGCASSDVKPEGKPGVEERTPGASSPVQPGQGPIVVEPVRPSDVAGNPLK